MYRDRPIPDMTEARLRRKGARAHPLHLNTQENCEDYVDARAHFIAGENYYYREDNPPYFQRAESAIPQLYVRSGILARLTRVNAILGEYGFELYLHDAYRPIELQNYYHDVWVPNYLRTLHPEWSTEQIADETGTYWGKGAPSADMVDPYSPPLHSTGAVVDTTMRSLETGELADMGSPFDDINSISFVDHFEVEARNRSLSSSHMRALEHRRILYWAMTESGFVVNPNEWWHFGYGDQLSAKLSGAPHALYSFLRLAKEH